MLSLASSSVLFSTSSSPLFPLLSSTLDVVYIDEDGRMRVYVGRGRRGSLRVSLFILILTACPPQCCYYCRSPQCLLCCPLYPPGRSPHDPPQSSPARHFLALLCALLALISTLFCNNLLLVFPALLPLGQGQKEARDVSLWVFRSVALARVVGGWGMFACGV